MASEEKASHLSPLILATRPSIPALSMLQWGDTRTPPGLVSPLSTLYVAAASNRVDAIRVAMPLAENLEFFGARSRADYAKGPDQTSHGSEGNLWFVLSLLFAASGCAALIYEIVWFQMLQLVIGSTAISLAVLLSSFMGGLSLGSVLLPSRIGLTVRPLRAWAWLELCLGGLGMGVYLVMPLLGKVFAGTGTSGFTAMLLRAAPCAACLVPSTMLMGATLPTISRLAASNRQGMFQLGLVYGANTLGAVFGALFSGFVLLRIFNALTAICLAVAINLALAIVAFGLRTPTRQAARSNENDTAPDFHARWHIYATIALSGLCALAAEAIWTRLLSLMLGSTTYTFSIILGVFLLGLGIGSIVGAVVGRQGWSPTKALGICQLLLAVATTWAAVMLANSLPYWPLNPTASKSVWINFQVDLLRCLWAILPATCLWGASFPLALTATAEPGKDPGRLVSKVYAANTLGAIAGAVGASVFMIAWVGTQRSQQLLIALSLLAAMLALAGPSVGQVQERMSASKRSFSIKFAGSLAAIGLALLLAWCVPPVPWGLIAYGRYLPMKTDMGRVLYVAEGMNASVAVTEMGSGVRNFHVSGKIEASTDQQDMRLQRMLGHIPALFHPDPRAVLVVGCGAGVTAGSFLTHPGIDRIDLCEIEPLIPRVVARFFGEENYDVIQDSRVRLVYDDARHYIFSTHDTYDIITSDPIHPWVKGAAALYTKEYFELCKRHLNPGGMVTQWVPLYESDVATVKSELATFFEVFPQGTIWSNDDMGSGYDLVLLGQADPLEVDVGTMQQRLSRADHQAVAQSLRDVGIKSAFGLAATYAGQARDLGPWLKNAQINHDRDLRLQYLAGLGLNSKQSDFIYEALSDYRRFPEEIFIGSNLWNDALRRTLARPKQSRDAGNGKNRD